MADFDIYLYFSGSSKEPSAWDAEFGYFLGILLNQILENPPRILANASVPGSTLLKKIERTELAKIRAFILVVGEQEKEDYNYQLVKEFLSGFSPDQMGKLLLVRRPQRRITEIPDFLKKFPVYNFYELALNTQVVFEFNPNEKGVSENSFWDRLTDLAYDLKSLLFGKIKVEVAETRANTVFLAEVTQDQFKNRDRLRRELLLSGYHVLPDAPLPLGLREFEDEVRNMLENSVLSIHMMGELYGNSPEGTDYSYPEIQNRLFLDVSKKLINFNDIQPKISRIVWIQPIFDPYDEKQVQYIKRLRRDISVTKDSELIQSTIHDLKSIVDQKFALLKAPLDDLLMTEDNGVLLIADDYRDVACTAIKDDLQQASLNLTLLKSLAIMQNDIAAIVNEMKKYKNVLVLSSKSDNNWLQSILNLLARSKGYQGAVASSIVGVFSPSQIKKVPQFHMLPVEQYIYNSKNINNIVKTFISKIKT